MTGGVTGWAVPGTPQGGQGWREGRGREALTPPGREREGAKGECILSMVYGYGTIKAGDNPYARDNINIIIMRQYTG